MSSTSNAQDLLVNVFRPTYRWQAGTGFVPSLVVSNVTELIASKIKTDALVVSDSNVNTYIGSNAGVLASNTFSNVGIGYSAMGGALNATCNVAIGTFALDGLSNSDCNVALGAGTDISGTGNRNVLIGTNVALFGGGSNNILIGVDLSRTTISNTLQIGSLLYGNLSNGYIGINTTVPNAPLDVSGQVVFRNKVGIQTESPVYSLDVLGSAYVSNQVLTEYGSKTAPAYSFVSNKLTGIYQASDASYGTGAVGTSVNGMARVVVTSNKTYIYGNLDVCGTFSAAAGGGGSGGGTVASNGTVAAPSFTFSNDLSTGLHLGGTSYLAFDTSGVQRMCISGGFVGIGTPTPRVALDVSGDISANVYNGPGGTQAAPHYTFSDDRTTGLFFPGANIVGLTAGGTERMRISNSNIGIGTKAPTNALDVSGTLRVIGTTGGDITFTNGAIAIAGNTVVSSTGVLSNGSTTSNSIGGVTLSNTNVSGVTTLTATNGLVSGYLRNTLIPTQFDISGGNISNSGTHTASNFSGTSSASNSIGGVTLSNTNISYAGTITGSTANTSNSIGGVTLSNTNISYAGTITGSTASASNQIGGVTLSNTNITYAGAISNTTASSSNSIGGVTLSNLNAVTGNGTVAAPSVCLADASTGFYRPNATPGIYGSLAGVRVLGMTSNLIEFSNRGSMVLWLTDNQLLASTAATVSSPAYAYAGDASLGFYRVGANTVGFATAGINRMNFSNSVLGIGRTLLADTSFVLQLPSNGYATAGRLYLGDPANTTPAYGGTIIEGLSNGGGGACDLLLYSRASGSGAGTDPRERMRIVGTTGFVGVGTSNPAYTLDVCGSATAPSINLATWPRIPLSNCLMVKGIPSGAQVGNTLNFNTVVRTINSTLGTFTASNATSGGSLLINKAGIWSITLAGSTGNGTNLWMDVSTGNHSNIGVYTNGNPVLAAGYSPGVGTSNVATASFTGFLPSNIYVKARINGALGPDSDVVWRLNAIFQAETDAVTTWPF